MLMAYPHRYSEAVNILYTVNVFSFNYFNLFESFFSTVGPQKFQNIRSIQLTWDYYPTTFLSATISGMKGLQYLYLIIEAHHPPYSAERERQIVAPLKSLSGIKDFQVRCLWCVREDTRQFLEDAPFVLHTGPRTLNEW